MISTMTPAASSPASRARSMAASVCPARRSTPPRRARRGKMWPGRPSSSGRVVGSMRAWMVLARSWALIPVVHPLPTRSTLTVKGVSNAALLRLTMSSSSSSSQRSSMRGAQIKPRPSTAMKLIISGVANRAAATKSPSFSRSSSSTTMITFPCRMSSMASSMVSRALLCSAMVQR